MEKQKYIEMTNVKINGGFWKYRQDLNANTTINVVKKIWENKASQNLADFSWDNVTLTERVFAWFDFEKWIESISYMIQTGYEDEVNSLIPMCELIADRIQKAQKPDGYYNRYIMATDSARWTNRNAHELYYAGHLIDAGLAYYNATGKRILLDCAIRLADHIEKVFVKEDSAAFVTGGHPGIELALVNLFRATGEKRYLELSRFFIDKRGANDKDKPINPNFNARLDQSHLPVREQTTAEGHAVRACYLFSAMADLAYEYEDDTLLNACKNLFDNIEKKRMYITGGIGSSYYDEGFTIDYDLPNLDAYCETCSSYAMMMFAKRMLLLETDSRYADVFEKILFNSFLSGTSLTGDTFFYENPLEMDPKLIDQEIFAVNPKGYRSHMLTQRAAFPCCCLTNITRFIASIGGCIYTRDDNTVYVHQFIESNGIIPMDGYKVSIRQETDYPVNGVVKMQVDGGNLQMLAVRIPGWCRKWYAETDGKAAQYTMQKGYAYFRMPFKELVISFYITPFAVEANPFVQNNAGRITIQRGPVVYCLEAIDNGKNLRDIHIDLRKPITVEENQMFKFPVLRASGWRRDHDRFSALYQEYSNTRKEQELYFIPYYAFANRGETEMIVWINP